MKRLLLIVPFCICLLMACEEPFDYQPQITDLQQQIDSLKTVCSSMNENIASLQTIVQALQNNDYVTSVTPIKEGDTTIGYTLSFSKSDPISIYHGHNPQIGIKQREDGLYYWTLEGEWLLDTTGNPILSEGLTPLLKIENGRWLISLDKGQSWADMGQATGEKGDHFFQSVTEDANSVNIVLADGTVITLPKKTQLSIVFNDSIDVGILPSTSTEVRYTLKGADSSTIVKAIGQGGWMAKVTKSTDSTGVINVTAPSVITESEILVFVYDGAQTTIMSSLNFVQGVITIANTTYNINNASGLLTIPLLTNLAYTVSAPSQATWIQLTQTRSTRNDTLTLAYNANMGSERSTIISVKASSGSLVKNIAIVQEGGYIEPYAYYIPIKGRLDLLLNSIQKDTIQKMKLFGEINALDFSTLKTKLPRLEYLDLSEVSCEYNTIPSTAFGRYYTNLANRKLKSITIPQSITSIGFHAFTECTGLTGLLDLPSSITIIQEGAYAGCTGLSGNLILPTELTSIGKEAFSGCSGFTGTMIIPGKVTKIGIGAFNGCSHIEAFRLPHTTPLTFNQNMFPAGATIEVPLAAVDTYKASDGWKDYTIVGY